MKTICHRGNMNGPNPDMENHPIYIQNTLNAGYDVEVDVWLLSDGLYLGHDGPIHKIERHFLQNKKVWTHCKNMETFIQLSKISNINCFFQDGDQVSRTSHGYDWAHSKSHYFSKKTILTKLDATDYWGFEGFPFAICSDYIIKGTEPSKKIFDLLIIDIDGVMTDGTKIYDTTGKVFAKSYCDLDFTAIKRLKAAGINVCFLSGDKFVNEQMAKTRQIDFFHNTPGTDKVDYLSDIKKHYNAEVVAYVGDDYYDTTIMNMADLAFCPSTSPTAVKRCAQMINVPAGKGVIAGLYDIFEDSIPYAFPVDSADVNPK